MHALGIGNGADRAVIDAVAAAADRAGFATLWSGEHVVMVDESASRYPYSEDGRIAVPAAADWIDPLIGLSFVAAATSTIGIATGVLLLPEHNPVLVAKQAATLDTLSGGRLTLGVGIGWSREEFDALGVPFDPRCAPPSFDGEFVHFDPCLVPRSRCTTVVFRLWSVATATQRCAGWRRGVTVGYGFNLADVDAVADCHFSACPKANPDSWPPLHPPDSLLSLLYQYCRAAPRTGWARLPTAGWQNWTSGEIRAPDLVRLGRSAVRGRKADRR